MRVTALSVGSALALGALLGGFTAASAQVEAAVKPHALATEVPAGTAAVSQGNHGND